MQYVAVSAFVLLSLTGCFDRDQSSSAKHSATVSTTSPINESSGQILPAASESLEKSESTETPYDYEFARYTTDSAAIRQLKEDTFELIVLPTQIDLVANKANKLSILEDLSRKIPFQFSASVRLEGALSMEATALPLPLLLAMLLEDVEYTAAFNSKPNNLGFQLTSVLVGPPASMPTESVADEVSLLSSIVLHESPVYLGDVPRKVELTERLFNSDNPEVRALAVRELRMDPSGFNAAVQVYRTDDDPQVRLEVLELISSEDYFGAKQIVVDSLSDPHVPTVLKALTAIDSQFDFSLVPYIEELYSHSDPAVQNRAREVRESLMSAYIDPSDIQEVDPTAVQMTDRKSRQ